MKRYVLKFKSKSPLILILHCYDISKMDPMKSNTVFSKQSKPFMSMQFTDSVRRLRGKDLNNNFPILKIMSEAGFESTLISYSNTLPTIQP